MNEVKITIWEERIHLPVSMFLSFAIGVEVLRYDANGFVLATKKLLDGMKFQWPKDEKEVDEISEKQLEWLLEGLEIEQKKHIIR